MNQEPQVDYTRNRKQRHRSSRSKTTLGGRLVSEMKDWLLTAVIVFAVMSVLNVFVFNISTVKGQSMQPTLWEGERLFINKISLLFVNPKHGDVVILHDPSTGPSHKEYLVKRVIGIPGDIIEVRNHQLYVNGKIVNEPYIDTEIEDPDFAALTVESGNYFVMGDNRHASASKDSRYFGSISQDMIVGRADYIWWPLSKLNRL
ncbi:signal peptidase I [Paenibacillus sp. FSL R7-0048]|uniref:signal peptidase I n=1 Tax=Paenibacillus TaxID=44249 RepID=UPI00096F08AE|nr:MULTISPECIES: signal peptidase I [Paenibacillus]MDH6429157.1 signal peptidase I [Paenibacillus sp. PastH-4]MDH6445364.1 signal peptidase I [Paenibacillus sp. PastF-4]MDH6529252.1 signal peptidase I [Paenibacillus sp. PastH-3]OMC70440.1 signal peptidase I [Paenibacillus odorifer]OMD07395.1 signal peptidase I [Paenibacillus odorifer]